MLGSLYSQPRLETNDGAALAAWCTALGLDIMSLTLTESDVVPEHDRGWRVGLDFATRPKTKISLRQINLFRHVAAVSACRGDRAALLAGALAGRH